MKIKDIPNKEDIIYPEDTQQNMHFKDKTTREMDIADLDFQLSELEDMPNTPFNRKKRKEIEQHRRELVKAQRADEREKIKLAKAKRKEEKKQAIWQRKSIEAETATKLAEENQREALARDRRRRARRRLFDRIFDIIGKIVFGIIIAIIVLYVSNQNVRDKVAITFNNLFEYVESIEPNDKATKSDKDSSKQNKTEKKTKVKKDIKK